MHSYCNPLFINFVVKLIGAFHIGAFNGVILLWNYFSLRMRLSDLKPGETGVIVKILGHGAFRKRVMEMGFVKGREITLVLNAPLLDPIKFHLMDYEVSLRKSEASMI